MIIATLPPIFPSKYSQSVHHLSEVSPSRNASVREHKVEPEASDARAVADVTEHDAVEEGERRRRKEGRVGFLVTGNAVRVYELLVR